MKLCKCGCGKEVINDKNRFINGHYSRTQEFIDKSRKTLYIHYGVDSPLQSKELHDKKKQTCKNKYGNEHPTKTKEIKEKQIKSQIEKGYGICIYSSNINIYPKWDYSCCFSLS